MKITITGIVEKVDMLASGMEKFMPDFQGLKIQKRTLKLVE